MHPVTSSKLLQEIEMIYKEQEQKFQVQLSWETNVPKGLKLITEFLQVHFKNIYVIDPNCDEYFQVYFPRDIPKSLSNTNFNEKF